MLRLGSTDCTRPARSARSDPGGNDAKVRKNVDYGNRAPRRHTRAAGAPLRSSRLFCRTVSRRRVRPPGYYVQENYSRSDSANVVRGLHFQIPPFTQAKLVRVVSGAILDVAVDLRWGSPNYGRHTATILTAAGDEQLYIPEGFAHGFRTIEPGTGVQYRVNTYYSREHDRGVLWNDPQLGIEWQLAGAQPLLSDRDQRHPRLAELPHYFSFSETG